MRKRDLQSQSPTLSTTEAEFVAACTAGQEGCMAQDIVQRIRLPFSNEVNAVGRQSVCNPGCQKSWASWQDETFGFALLLAQRQSPRGRYDNQLHPHSGHSYWLAHQTPKQGEGWGALAQNGPVLMLKGPLVRRECWRLWLQVPFSHSYLIWFTFYSCIPASYQCIFKSDNLLLYRTCIGLEARFVVSQQFFCFSSFSLMLQCFFCTSI